MPDPSVVRADLWDIVFLAEFVLLLPKMGRAKVKCKSAQKLDEKAGSGTDKASTTQQGVKLTDVEIELMFTHRAWLNYVLYAVTQLDPNNLERLGGPFDIRHIDVNRRNCTSVLVEEISDVEWVGAGVGKVTIKCKEWVPAPPTLADASKTPDASDKSTDQNSSAAGGTTGAGTEAPANNQTPGAQNDSGLPADSPNTGT